MNRIRSISSIPPERRSDDRIGPARLRCVSFDAADLSGAARFFAALGLVPTADAGTAWTVRGSDQPCISLTGGSRKQLKRLTFSCSIRDLAMLRERAVGAGRPPVREMRDQQLVLCGPDDVEVELVAEAAAPLATPGHDDALILSPSPLRNEAPSAEPLALSHAAIFVTDVDAALAFYVDMIGLRLSDRCGADLAFLHSPHGSGHHVLALVRSDGPGLHHYSFEMGTLDAVGLRASHMRESGYADGWGMGRHVLGSNFFHYVRDPWGSHAELTTGLDFIAADADWVARDHVAHDAFYLWGPAPPAGFIDNPETLKPARPVAA